MPSTQAALFRLGEPLSSLIVWAHLPAFILGCCPMVVCRAFLNILGVVCLQESIILVLLFMSLRQPRFNNILRMGILFPIQYVDDGFKLGPHSSGIHVYGSFK